MEIVTTSVGVAGQRPHHQRPEERAYANAEIPRVIEKLHRDGMTRLVSPLGPGAEQEAARCAVVLGVPLVATLPFPNEGRHWDDEWAAGLHELVGVAEEIHYATQDRRFHAYNLRNQALVDRSTMMVVVTNGHPRGGTWDAARRAVASLLPLVVIDTAERRTSLFEPAAFARSFGMDVPVLEAVA